MKQGFVFHAQLPLMFLAMFTYVSTDNGCTKKETDMVTERNVYKKGRLTSRPKDKAAATEFKTGVQPLNVDGKRDGFIYVPKGYNTARPAALAVMLHGAGGQAEHGLNLLRQYADDKNIILVAPASRGATWDIIVKDSFDADVIFIDQALSLVFDSYNIDTTHIAVGGFSDGASYALCLGLSNGDLFTHVIAFSPGFYYTVENKGKPTVYISHGVNDGILPINSCSRRIVPQLQRLGYTVNYKEFNGEHEIPSSISQSAVDLFVNR
ncbi:MAG: phospholipase [Segetibacter sp.]|nr:phospholipase [Segetibacter sp.]